MAKTVYYTATTLDGYIADPNNSLEWLFAADSGDGEHYKGFLTSVGALVMGATTFEWIVDYVNLLQEPEKWHEWYGDRPTWVFSHRTLPIIEGADIRFVSGDVAPVYAEASAAIGDRTLWIVGGGDLAGQFADAGLLQEIQVSIAPVTLGGGAPLLPRVLLSKQLTLREISQQGQFAALTYDVIANAED